MILSFEITMPNAGSWNGVWTGAKNLHFAFKNVENKRAKEIIDKSYHYNFGDGWSANVNVSFIDSKTRAKIKRKNTGFMGYDWMIDSIIKNNKIIIED